MRKRLSAEVRNILKRLGITAILVTHDQDEAFALAVYIGLIHERRIVQWSSHYQLYHEPASRFVANFIGEGFSYLENGRGKV